ncbi:MAG TPA: glycosyltransferase family A protein [Opitutaceae bacterium]|nr:glycosyltransferase family A protein [Opitutaceae bacterium]
MAATVSVLIPAFNAARFLPDALQSLRAQTHRTWELIVVEDGSNDGTDLLVRDFAAEMSQPIRYTNLGTNRGVAAARNRLLQLAQGDYIAFLDADDRWQPGHLATLVNCLARGGHALAFTGIEIWDALLGRSVGEHIPHADLVAAPRRGLFLRSFIQTSSCVALPRATVRRVGLFDEALRIGEDRDYWFRALAGGGTLGCTQSVTCRYNKHDGSSMTRTLRVAEDTVRFYEKHSRAEDIPARLRDRLLADSRWTLARLLRESDSAEAIALGWQAWRATPWRPHLLAWCLAAQLLRRRR